MSLINELTGEMMSAMTRAFSPHGCFHSLPSPNGLGYYETGRCRVFSFGLLSGAQEAQSEGGIMLHRLLHRHHVLAPILFLIEHQHRVA